MSYHGKEVEVVITGEAKDFYEKLSRDMRKSKFNMMLWNSIKEKIDLLKNDPSYGIQVPKDRIPKEYVLAYGADNLWKINLAGHWRMIYTIKGKEVKIIALVMDIFDHKEYDKKFKYRKK